MYIYKGILGTFLQTLYEWNINVYLYKSTYILRCALYKYDITITQFDNIMFWFWFAIYKTLRSFRIIFALVTSKFNYFLLYDHYFIDSNGIFIITNEFLNSCKKDSLSIRVEVVLKSPEQWRLGLVTMLVYYLPFGNGLVNV